MESWFESIGTGRLNETLTRAISKEYIHSLYATIENLKSLRPFLDESIKKRKPRCDDDANFYLYVMGSHLRSEGVKPEAAIYRTIMDEVNAHFYSENPDHPGMTQEDVRKRCERFQERNPTLATKIRSDPRPYTQLGRPLNFDKA